MQISSTGASALTTATSGQANARLLAGDLADQLIPSVPITATVKSAGSGQAVLDLGTSTMILRTTDDSLKPGTTVTVRFQENGKGIVDLGEGKTTTVMLETGNTAPAQSRVQTPQPRTGNGPAVYTPLLQRNVLPQFSQSVIRVEVLPAPIESATPAIAGEPLPEGSPTKTQAQAASGNNAPTANSNATGPRGALAANAGPIALPMPRLQPGEVLVRGEGRTFAARFADAPPDTSNGPVFVRVTTTPRGIVLSPLPETAQTMTQVATSLVRSSIARPEIGEIVQTLLQPSGAADAVKTAASAEAPSPALKNLTDFLTALLPRNGQPPDAAQIAEFVKNGGLQYEAKLGEAVLQKTAPKELAQLPAGDVKGQVMQALREAGGVDRSGSLHNALDSIESQQALNVLAAQSGEGVRLQLPIWDQSQWKTLDLTIKPETSDKERPDGQWADGYDILMHTELKDFGETYIDVQVHSGSFRSVLYIEQDTARAAAQSAVGELHQELRTLGFRQVFVEVRSVAELPARTRDQAHALKSGVPTGVSMLDVRV